MVRYTITRAVTSGHGTIHAAQSKAIFTMTSYMGIWLGFGRLSELCIQIADSSRNVNIRRDLNTLNRKGNEGRQSSLPYPTYPRKEGWLHSTNENRRTVFVNDQLRMRSREPGKPGIRPLGAYPRVLIQHARPLELVAT